MTLMVLVAGCGQDTSAGEPAAPEITAESKRQTCLSEWMTIEWIGEQLEIVVYRAIDDFEAGDIETSQDLYDNAAQIVGNLPTVAAAFEVHASAADLDEEQQAEPAQQDGIDCCEVTGHGCLGPQELGPRHLRSRGCGFNAGVVEDLPDRGCS